MSRPIVLSLCDHTGIMVYPWIEAGYECWTVDIQHDPGIQVHRHDRHDECGDLVTVGADVTRWLPPRADYRIVFGFPPCTNLAVSGARWFTDKGLAGLADGLRVVEAVRDICEWSGAPWMIENPVSTLSTYWREPDHQFDPCEYGGWVDGGDAYTKRTCLWTGAGFVIPARRPVPPSEGSRMHKLPPSADRADLRSATPAGFARAVFEANENGVVWDAGTLFEDAS